MRNRLVVMAILLAASGLGYELNAAVKPGAPAGKPRSAVPRARAPGPAAGPQDKLVVTVELGARGRPSPAAGAKGGAKPEEAPERGPGRGRMGGGMGRGGMGSGMGHGAGCFQTQVAMVLGVSIASPHGIIIGGVSPGGPAARAGIKAGDSIVACDGREVTCPSTLVPLLGAGQNARQAKLTILRPKAATGTPPEAGPKAAKALPGGAGQRTPTPAKGKPSPNARRADQGRR